MHLQEIFDLTLTQCQGHIKPCPLHHVTYVTAKVWSCYGQWLRRCITKKIHYLTLIPRLGKGVKVTQNVAQYPQLHVTYAPAKFDVATAYDSGEDAFTRKYYIWPWPWGQGHTKCCPVPSTSCDLCANKVWYCYIPRLRRKCIYK